MMKVINNYWNDRGNWTRIDWGESYYLGIYNDIESLPRSIYTAMFLHAYIPHTHRDACACIPTQIITCALIQMHPRNV